MRNLPHELVEAFKSTLDEVAEADLLVHVVDASAASPEGNIAAVDEVLSSIEAARIPQLIVFNKTDVAWPSRVEQLLDRYPGSVAISAFTGGRGRRTVASGVPDRIRALTNVVELLIPYSRGDLLAARASRGRGPRGEPRGRWQRVFVLASTTRRPDASATLSWSKRQGIRRPPLQRPGPVPSSACGTSFGAQRSPTTWSSPFVRWHWR